MAADKNILPVSAALGRPQSSEIISFVLNETQQKLAGHKFSNQPLCLLCHKSFLSFATKSSKIKNLSRPLLIFLAKMSGMSQIFEQVCGRRR